MAASAWCHGNNDFIQVDQKTMFNYTDHGSAQNRFCGTSLPRIGGIDNNNVYVSEENQLILWLKTNGDTNIGMFHLHFFVLAYCLPVLFRDLRVMIESGPLCITDLFQNKSVAYF